MYICYNAHNAIHEEADYNYVYPIEYSNTLETSRMFLSNLELKVDINHTLEKLESKKWLCNGTNFIVTNLCDQVIESQILVGDCQGQLEFIP